MNVLFSGLVSGALCTAIVTPIERLKINFQNINKEFYNKLTTINLEDINKNYYFEEDLEKYIIDCNNINFIPILENKKIIGLIERDF